MDANSNPRAAQVRLAPASPAKTGGQRKHDLRIGRQPDYVDSTRSKLNRVLIEPKTAGQMQARAIERRDRKPRRRVMKANAAVSFSGIITFGHLAHLSFERLTAAQQDAAFLDLAQAVAKLLKAELTGLVVHVDEAGLHAHFQLDAYDDAGNALSDQINRATLRQVQDLTAEVMGRHAEGIERGRGKVDRLKAGAAPGDVVYKKPAEMRRRLAEDLEKAEKDRADLDAERTKLAARVAKLQAFGEELTEKGAKQLETAQRRLEAKEAEFTAAEARLQTLRQTAQEAAHRAAEAERQAEAAEARLGPLRAAVAALAAHEAEERDRQAQLSQLQPEDVEQAVQWLLAEPLQIKDREASALELDRRLQIMDPDATFSANYERRAIAKLLLDRRDLWPVTIEQGENGPRVRAKLDVNGFRSVDQPQKSPGQYWPTFGDFALRLKRLLRVIGGPLNFVADQIRAERVTAAPPLPVPPAAAPAASLPEPVKAAIRELDEPRRDDQRGPPGP